MLQLRGRVAQSGGCAGTVPAAGAMCMTPVSILATASVLPEAVISNRTIGELLIMGSRKKGRKDPDAEAQTRARAETIEQKTGLVSRRFFGADQTMVGVGREVLEKLLPKDWSQLDALIVSSSSAHGFPGLSQQIVAEARSDHPELGHPFVLDIGSNACTGFMYALTIATSLIQTQSFRRVACIAIEFSSRCVAYDMDAFGISTLFGDASSGVLLGAGKGLAIIERTRASSLLDKEKTALIKGGGTEVSRPDIDVPENARWFMAGPPVAVGATKILVDEIKRYREEGHEIDWLIPHQANLTRILIPACKQAGLDPAKLCASFAETGNTSSASIPLLLDMLLKSKKTTPGQKVLMIGFGASFTLGSALLTLNAPGH
jgi:3-oxoacyl-[acyl-carrier-protein] synthase-3